MVNNKNRHRNSWWPIRWAIMHQGANFFSFGDCRQCWVFRIFVVSINSKCVLITFTLVSQHVPQFFGSNTSFYSISFAATSICFAINFRVVAYMSNSKWEEYNIYILGLSKALIFIYFMYQSKMPITLKKIELWGFQLPTNMYDTCA